MEKELTEDAPPPPNPQARVVEYLMCQIERVRADLETARKEYKDAILREREHERNLAALEGVLKMLNPPAPPAAHPE